MISREEAFDLLKKYVKNENIIKHCRASEVVLRALARRLGEDEERWGIAGLLHDIDVEITEADLHRHCLEVEKLLRGKIDGEMIDAIVMHNEVVTGKERSTIFQHAISCGETITGLVIATALVYPDKKLASVKPKSITKRMKQKAFAASVSRENIMECEKIGIPINEFAQLALSAIQDIHVELGL